MASAVAMCEPRSSTVRCFEYSPPSRIADGPTPHAAPGDSALFTTRLTGNIGYCDARIGPAARGHHPGLRHVRHSAHDRTRARSAPGRRGDGEPRWHVTYPGQLDRARRLRFDRGTGLAASSQAALPPNSGRRWTHGHDGRPRLPGWPRRRDAVTRLAGLFSTRRGARCRTALLRGAVRVLPIRTDRRPRGRRLTWQESGWPTDPHRGGSRWEASPEHPAADAGGRRTPVGCGSKSPRALLRPPSTNPPAGSRANRSALRPARRTR